MTQPIKILIAEDDRMTRRILQYTFDNHEALAHRVFELTMATDGAEALAQFRIQPHDLIILDLFMPRVDGFTLCESIREHPRGASVPIIVMSAIWKQPQLLERLKSSYDVQFLEKPFVVDDFAALVRSLLDLAP